MVTSSGILPLETLCSFLTFNFHLRNLNTHLRVLKSVNTLPRNTSNHGGEKSRTSHSFSSVMFGMGADGLMLKLPEVQRSRDFQQKKRKISQVAEAMISFQLDPYHKNEHCHHHQSLFFLLLFFLFFF